MQQEFLEISESSPMSVASFESPYTMTEPGKSMNSERARNKLTPPSKRRRLSPTENVRHTVLSIRPSDWRTTQSKLGLRTAGDYEKVILAFIQQRAFMAAPEAPGSIAEDLYLRAGYQLAQRTEWELCRTTLQARFSHFLAILFFSYYAALEALGVPPAQIDSMMDTLTSFRSRKRARLRRCGKQINVTIITLIENGWSLGQATEIFFLFAISPTNFDEMAFDEIFELICRHFSTRDFTTYSFRDCLGTQMTIPGLLIEIMGDKFQSTTFYNALGYPSAMQQEFSCSIREICPASCPAPSLRFINENDGRLHHCSDEERLLSLFAAFDPMGIPAVLFELSQEPQQRWDPNGTICEQTIDDVFLEPQLCDILKLGNLGSIIRSLRSQSLLEYSISDSRYITYSLPSDWRTLGLRIQDLPQSEPQIEALKLLCFIYPRDRFLSSSMTPSRYPVYAHSATIISILQAVLGEASLDLIPSSLRNVLVEVMLLASMEGQWEDRNSFLQLTLSYMDGETPEYLMVEATYQRSVLLRLAGEVQGSEDYLQCHGSPLFEVT